MFPYSAKQIVRYASVERAISVICHYINIIIFNHTQYVRDWIASLRRSQ